MQKNKTLPLLSDGTEVKEGMFVNNGSEVFYVADIYIPDNHYPWVKLIKIGELHNKRGHKFWNYRLGEKNVRSFTEMRAYKDHKIQELPLVPTLALDIQREIQPYLDILKKLKAV
jgi:hypothetical protein